MEGQGQAEAGAEATTGQEPFRVMVVDDSAVIRGLLTRALEDNQDIQVIASVANGQMAVAALDRHDIEVCILDIEMPVMDGLTALPKLLEKDRDLQVVMASTLTLRNADISLKALSLGAADYIPKPSARSELHTGGDFRRELVDKVRSLGRERRRRGGSARILARPGGLAPSPAAPSPTAPTPAPAPAAPGAAPKLSRGYDPGKIALRPLGRGRAQLLVIGSSTGGPQALFEVIGAVRDKLQLPVLITQHMPATFTTILAEHLGRVSGWPSREATDGERIEPRNIYIAPGDWHMVVERGESGPVIRLNQDPPVNFCRPSVDPMLQSISEVYGERVLVAILTGMGHDGLDGARTIVERGGTVIAQDEATSVVWGMPGAVATAGLCSEVLPIKTLGPRILELTGGGTA